MNFKEYLFWIKKKALKADSKFQMEKAKEPE